MRLRTAWQVHNPLAPYNGTFRLGECCGLGIHARLFVITLHLLLTPAQMYRHAQNACLY